jgi:glycosyltransferase involved in cell wall biosynthesis
MHILHVTPYYIPAYAFGGVVRSCEGMSRALVRRGHRVTVLTTDVLNQSQRGNSPSDEIVDGVRVVRARNTSMWLRKHANLSTPLAMSHRARQLLADVDVIHCHEFRTLENLLITPTAAAMQIPLVLSPHGTLTHETGRSALKAMWDELLSPGLAKRFRHVIGLSQAELKEVQELWASFGAKTPFSAIPNGVDIQDYANLKGRVAFRERYYLGDAPVCLFMSRLHPRKGVAVLIEAFKAAAIDGARLVIAGPDEGMLDVIQPMFNEQVIYAGYLNGADRLAAFAGADMLALPAVGEGLPMVVLEAMASGLPVIISPGCNLPEVPAYGAGIQVEVALEPLRDALHMLLTDSTRRTKMGTAAQTLVAEKFTWDTVASQLEAVYQQVTQSTSTYTLQ